jgi:restriction system protein
MVHSGSALESAAASQLNLGDLSQVEHTDLYRAAWVQAVSALDHWLHREIVSRAIVIINDRPTPRPDRLKAYTVSWATVEDMQNRSIDDVMSEHLTERLGRDSYQKPDRIAEGLQYVTHKKQGQIWREVAQIILPQRSVDEIKQRQTDIADRRNKIAHEADIDHLTGTRRQITAPQTAATIDWIESLALAIRTVLN